LYQPLQEAGIRGCAGGQEEEQPLGSQQGWGLEANVSGVAAQAARQVANGWGDVARVCLVRSHVHLMA